VAGKSNPYPSGHVITAKANWSDKLLSTSAMFRKSGPIATFLICLRALFHHFCNHHAERKAPAFSPLVRACQRFSIMWHLRQLERERLPIRSLPIWTSLVFFVWTAKREKMPRHFGPSPLFLARHPPGDHTLPKLFSLVVFGIVLVVILESAPCSRCDMQIGLSLRRC